MNCEFFHEGISGILGAAKKRRLICRAPQTGRSV